LTDTNHIATAAVLRPALCTQRDRRQLTVSHLSTCQFSTTCFCVCYTRPLISNLCSLQSIVQ